jgi:fumarylacetoacetase
VSAQSSWVSGADGSGFGLGNLPYGAMRQPRCAPELVVRIGDKALRLSELAGGGLLDLPGVDPAAFHAPNLNPLLAAGRDAWRATRERLTELLAAGSTEIVDSGLAERALHELAGAELLMPVAIGDIIDMYSSIEHATSVGELFRPDEAPLTPNWRHMPLGYHGRAATVVVSGTDVVRPWGQHAPAPPDERPTFEPEDRLDFELELGFVVGGGPPMGTPIQPEDAAEHIFGFTLVNDWSARTLQRWEYQPLGPFLGKSFATSISPWIVPLDALEPFRVPNVPQVPPPLPHLRTDEPWGLDLDLEVELTPGGTGRGEVITRTNARGVYWNPAQQLIHAASNGSLMSPGDVIATGTISGAEPGSRGCMLELTRDGAEALTVGSVTRTFLEDGDTVTMRGSAGRGVDLVSLGEVTGIIVPRPSS